MRELQVGGCAREASFHVNGRSLACVACVWHIASIFHYLDSNLIGGNAREQLMEDDGGIAKQAYSNLGVKAGAVVPTGEPYDPSANHTVM